MLKYYSQGVRNLRLDHNSAPVPSVYVVCIDVLPTTYKQLMIFTPPPLLVTFCLKIEAFVLSAGKSGYFWVKFVVQTCRFAASAMFKINCKKDDILFQKK